MDDGVVGVCVEMILDVFEKRIRTVSGADPKLVWFECLTEMELAMVYVGFGSEASERGSHAKWSDFVVWFEFCGECCCEDCVEGVFWKLTGGDAMDEDGKWFDVVWVSVQWLPMFVAAVVWAWLFAWGKCFKCFV